MTRTGRATAAVVLLGAVVGLSACDPREAGSAAVVGGYRITETQLDAAATEATALLDKLGADVPATDALLRAQLESMIDDRIVEEAARREGIVITQGQVDSLIDNAGGRDQLAQELLTQQNLWLPPSELDALARSFLVQQELGKRLAPTGDASAQSAAVSKYVADLAKELGVDVSPRYGAWDVSKLKVGSVPNDLSSPAPTAG